MLADFRWLEEDSELDLRLDDYHTAVKETSQPNAIPQRRPSFRRHLSLSSLPFRRSASLSSPPQSSPTANVPSSVPPSPRPLSTFFSPSNHRAQLSTSSIDPKASHYQDPAARLKLRVYLASPQKFDEAIEFGFPSSQEQLRYARSKNGPRLTQESGRTFYTDETPSLSVDGDDDREADREEDDPDPHTPEDVTFRRKLPLRKDSSDRRMTITPRVLREPHEPYAHASAANREMTLHLTLTRPDLRAADETVGTTVNDQPLEQPALHLNDTTTSIWDTLPGDDSRIKRVWRKLLHR